MTDVDTLTTARAALEQWVEPFIGRSLGELGALRELRLDGAALVAAVVLPVPVGGYRRTR